MKIGIVGWYGKKNVGDEAFRLVLSDFFAGHDVQFVTPPNVCGDVDIVVLGGGAVASPYYLDTLPVGIPRYALGIDMAYESEIELLKKAEFSGVVLRNRADYKAASSQLNCPVHLAPDLAFHIAPTGNPVLDKYRRFPGKKCLGVFVTDYVNPAIDRPVDKFAARAWSFKQQMARTLDSLARKGYEVMLVPCSTGGYGDDRRIDLDLAAFMATEPTNVMDTIGPQNMIDLTAGLDVALCMRFHAHVFSVIAGTPLVSVGVTRKVRLFLQENELDETGAGWFVEDRFNVDRLEAAVESASRPVGYFHKAAQYRAELDTVRRLVRKGWLGESA